MEHWPHCKCHLQIYRCKADTHFHLIVGPENFSWPFWSSNAGLKHVLFLKHGLLGDSRSPEEEQWVIEETDRIADEIHTLFMEEEHRVSQNLLYKERSVASAWVNFFTGRTPCIYYYDDRREETEVPLLCDFIERTSTTPLLSALSREEQMELAFAPAKPRSMEELEIKLQLIT